LAEEYQSPDQSPFFVSLRLYSLSPALKDLSQPADFSTPTHESAWIQIVLFARHGNVVDAAATLA
jgi:hypothetical protein